MYALFPKTYTPAQWHETRSDPILEKASVKVERVLDVATQEDCMKKKLPGTILYT